MNNLQLLQMALNNAKSESVGNFANKVVYVYFSKELNEYTIVPEANANKLLDIEPNLVLVAKFLNGEKIL